MLIDEAQQETVERTIPEIEIRPLQSGEDGTAFWTLNEEWITRFFVLEEKDREVLSDPEGLMLRGGHIFFVWSEGIVVGCVALIPTGDGVYELSKMAVAPSQRGLGIGRKLIEYAIARAREIGARSLFLGSSTKLKNAVHLYESIGFRHLAVEERPVNLYARADVFMDMAL